MTEDPTPEQLRAQTAQRRGSDLVRRVLADAGIWKDDDGEWHNETCMPHPRGVTSKPSATPPTQPKD